MSFYNCHCITGVAASICSLMGVEKPLYAADEIGLVTAIGRQQLGGNAQRAVIYNPDALALYLFQKYTDLYYDVLKNASLSLPMLSVMPSVTPVCFASMYTGAMPEVHGITKYTKPVLKTDTVFDAFLRAGKKVAIVSTEGDSISMIFLERSMDYFLFKSAEEVNDKAMELIEQDSYDLIVVYNGNYDATMHRNSPESPVSLDVLKLNCEVYDKLCAQVKRCYNGKPTVMAFAPDHGCHPIDGGMGSHGLDMEEDMNIMHFWSLIK